MFYLVYLSLNTVNSRYYIGAHKTLNESDSYLGSGVVLNRAIKKYGKGVFKRYTLAYCTDEKEMFELERRIIADALQDNQCYNLKPGGIGGFTNVNQSGINRGDGNAMRNSVHVETRLKSRHLKDLQEPGRILVRNSQSKQNLKLAVEANTGKQRPAHSILMQHYAKTSRGCFAVGVVKRLTRYELTCPEGKTYTLENQLLKFCKDRSLPVVTIFNAISTGKAPTKGRAKGWTCRKI